MDKQTSATDIALDDIATLQPAALDPMAIDIDAQIDLDAQDVTAQALAAQDISAQELPARDLPEVPAAAHDDFAKIKLRLNEIQLERTIEQLHQSLPEASATEAEATLRRIYARARRWDDLALAPGTLPSAPALSPETNVQGGCDDEHHIGVGCAEYDDPEKT